MTGDVANETVQKWSPVLEGIESEYTKRVTAQLLENQAKAIISEKVRMDEDVAQGIGGTTTTTRLGAFQKFAFPLVRRVYPELIANNIVGVQPMQGPVSQIFYLGNSRRDGLAGTPEQAIYSKYNLTYRGLTAGQIMASGTGNYQTDGTATGPGLPDGAPGVGFDVSDIMNATSGAPSTTIGGKIADFPTPGKMRGLATGPASLLGFNVSAGERLEGSGIPEMMFNIEQQPVAARTRTLSKSLPTFLVRSFALRSTVRSLKTLECLLTVSASRASSAAVTETRSSGTQEALISLSQGTQELT